MELLADRIFFHELMSLCVSVSLHVCEQDVAVDRPGESVAAGWNQVRECDECSADRWVVQSQQCCNYVNMRRITLTHMSICAFTF